MKKSLIIFSLIFALFATSFAQEVKDEPTGAKSTEATADDKDGNKRYTVDVALDNFEFVESKAQREASANSSDSEPTPYDYQEPVNEVNVEDDPFAEFGDSVSIDDNFLE